MKIIVQKFGGTSVSTSQSREKAAQKVIEAKSEGFFPIVVVSAMGRMGEPYATDTLIEFARQPYDNIHPRELDLIMSCGEVISAVVMANTLRSKGIDAMALTGEHAGMITDDNYGSADVLRVQTKNLFRCIEKGKVPVITGFQGVTESGDITTLGRGGSDVTAVVLGKAVNAHLVEIYTDVDGVMTADPRMVPDAKTIGSMDYNEVFQMADYGARVIHPRAAEIAMHSNVPLVIKNTFSETHGTLITQLRQEPRTFKVGDRGLLTGIAHLCDRTQIIIDYSANPENNFNDGILDKLAALDISIDLINIFTDKKIFTIDSKDTDRTIELLKKEGHAFEVNGECSKVTIIGNRIRGVPGVMARMLNALARNGIKVYQTADSHTTISALVKKAETEKAVTVLHNEFGLNK